MNSLCFACGKPKQDPLNICVACKKVPANRKDREISMVLSKDCVGEEQLRRTIKFFERKKRLPPISDAAREKARRLLEQQLITADSSSSMNFSSSFFDFTPQKSGEAKNRTITIHAIGKHKGASDLPPTSRRLSTYHTDEWVVGVDVSEADAASLADSTTGCLYVWYRWAGGRWSHQLISRIQFQQLKAVEDAG